MNKEEKRSIQIRGIGITNRRAAGILRMHKPHERVRRAVSTTTEASERARLEQALASARAHTVTLYERAVQLTGEEAAQIFEIHAMLLEDDDFLEALWDEIERGVCAEEALAAASERFEAMLKSLDDAYLSARAADIRDVCDSVLHFLEADEGHRDEDDAPYILLAEDLSPSQTVLLDKARILGFVTLGGTPSSHTAILARAMGIPALVGVGGTPEAIPTGVEALLDAADGTLTLFPTAEQRRVFAEKMEQDDRIAREHDRYLRALMNKPAVTKSGHRILIYANVGGADEVAGVLGNGADGIGLLRSEFLYLSRTDYPDEDTLAAAYTDIATRMQGKRTVIRTLDVGADKRIPYFGLPEEENPAMGFRALRICLDRRNLFKTQLRAILRASAYGRLAVMLPMVVSVDEVRESRRILAECREELARENQRFDPSPEFGIMIETPAAVMMCEELAGEVDFFSVGTNDLAQYTLAADRQNPALDYLFRENVEPILRMIAQVTAAIHRHGGWIGICGELAADLSLTQRFADLRVDELSVSVPYLLGVRGKVTECQ